MISKRKAPKPLRRAMRRAGLFLAALLIVWAIAAEWFVHHPRPWIENKCENGPRFLFDALLLLGNPLGETTDAIGITGSDAVVESGFEPPARSAFFAGAPRRTGTPAPADLTVIDKGPFVIGWSPSLRHPVWCAYKVPRDERFPQGDRPGFKKDPAVPSAPPPSAYSRSGYDRGHMAPNHAIATRYGKEAQKISFLTSNIAPQSPSLNRGVWREIEHRISDMWTGRWGDVWVVAGALSTGLETVSGTDIDVPVKFWQVVAAKSGGKIRAFAVLIEQEVPWRAWPTRYIVSIDELESLTGLDFFPDLEDVEEEKLESALPSRLWPVKFADIFKMLVSHGGKEGF